MSHIEYLNNFKKDKYKFENEINSPFEILI